jgi:hypothetical protein
VAAGEEGVQRILATLIIEEAVGDGATGAALDAVARAVRDEEFPGQALEWPSIARLFWNEGAFGEVIRAALARKSSGSMEVFARAFNDSVDATLVAFTKGVVPTRLITGGELPV